jgi:hypothetical protein
LDVGFPARRDFDFVGRDRLRLVLLRAGPPQLLPSPKRQGPIHLKLGWSLGQCNTWTLPFSLLKDLPLHTSFLLSTTEPPSLWQKLRCGECRCSVCQFSHFLSPLLSTGEREREREMRATSRSSKASLVLTSPHGTLHLLKLPSSGPICLVAQNSRRCSPSTPDFQGGAQRPRQQPLAANGAEGPMATFTVARRSHAASLTAFPHPIGLFQRSLPPKEGPAGALQAPSTATIVTPASAPAAQQTQHLQRYVPCANRPPR